MNNLIKPSILITLLITLVSCGGGGGSSPSVISAPSAPSNLTAAANNESQITLNWTSASGVTYYEIHRHTSDDSTAAAKINSPLSSAGTSFENTGLTINTTYYYWLKACNDTGCSNFSTEANATTTPPAPSNLSATVNNANQITLSWDQTTGATRYEVYRHTSDDSTAATKINTETVTDTSYINTGLTESTKYYYWIKACHDTGCSDFSTGVNDTTTPPAPSNLSATTNNESQITLNWDQTTGATYYEIHRHTSDDSTAAAKINSPLSSAGTSFENTGLTINTTYYYWLKACHDTGCSALSSGANTTTAPSAPSNLTATANNANQITLNWDQATGATYYGVYRHISDDSANAKKVNEAVTATSYADTGLTESTTYYYWIKACNDTGCSAISSGVNVATIPLAPSGFKTTASSASQITLNWTSASGVMSYKIYRHTSDDSTAASTPISTSDTSYTDTGLIADTKYYYWIKACNGTGCSDFSSVASAIVNKNWLSAEHIKTLYTGDYSTIRSVAFSPDSSKIVSGSADKTIKIWDVSDNYKLLKTIGGHGGTVKSVVFSLDGTKIVSGSTDQTIKIWDASNYSLLKTIASSTTNKDGHEDPVSSVAFSPDGTKIVSGSIDQTIKIWDVSDNYKLLKTIAVSPTSADGHSHWVMSVAFSPDGTKIVSGSFDKTIKIWDVSDNYKLLKTIADSSTNADGHSDQVRSVAFSPDGTKIVSGSEDYIIKIWDVDNSYSLVKTFEKYDVNTNPSGHKGRVNSVVFSPDGTKIVSISYDETIKIWNVDNKYELVKTFEKYDANLNPNGHMGSIYSVAFSPDGTKIISGSDDRKVKIWE